MSTWSVRSLGLLTLVSFLSFVAPAQETKPPEPVNANSTFQTAAQEVSLDIVVRDAKGKIVKNVTPADLAVFEDGKKQDLLDFRFISGREGAAAVASPGSAAAAGQAKAPRTPINDVNVVCMVFHALDPSTKKNAIDFARQFVQNNLPPNTWVGLLALDDKLTPLHEFTDDRSEMLRAINSAHTGNGQDFLSMASRVLTASPNIFTIASVADGSTSDTTAIKITGGEVSLQAITGADVSNGQGADRVRGDQVDARRQFTGVSARRNFDSLNVLISQLALLPGHKSVLFFSGGIVGLGDPDRMEKMLKRANQAEITFYAVDVNGLSQNSNGLAANNALNYASSVSQTQQDSGSSAAAMMEKMRQGDYITQGVRQSDGQAVLRQISEDTGGFLIGNSNDLRKPFERVIQDLDSHYEAVYRPAGAQLDGALRTIEVKVNHPGWTVESRTGYYALPMSSAQSALGPADLMGLAALNLKPTPHAFAFDSTSLQFRASANGVQRAIAFELPVRNLGVTTLPGGQNYRVHASVLILVKNAKGDVVDKYSQDSPFEFPASALKQAAFSTLEFAHPIDLPPGKYTAAVAVVDQEAKRSSVSSFDFENAEPKPLELSSVTLVQRVQAVSQSDPADPFVLSNGSEFRRVVPEIRPALGKDAKPMAFFVVYPNQKSSDKPRLQVEVLVNGKPLARQVSDLGPPAADGSIPMLVGAPLTKGECELKITALQGDVSATQSLHYSVNP